MLYVFNMRFLENYDESFSVFACVNYKSRCPKIWKMSTSFVHRIFRGARTANMTSISGHSK